MCGFAKQLWEYPRVYVDGCERSILLFVIFTLSVHKCVQSPVYSNNTFPKSISFPFFLFTFCVIRFGVIQSSRILITMQNDTLEQSEREREREYTENLASLKVFSLLLYILRLRYKSLSLSDELAHFVALNFQIDIDINGRTIKIIKFNETHEIFDIVPFYEMRYVEMLDALESLD